MPQIAVGIRRIAGGICERLSSRSCQVERWRIRILEIPAPCKQSRAKQLTPLRKDGLLIDATAQLYCYSVQHGQLLKGPVRLIFGFLSFYFRKKQFPDARLNWLGHAYSDADGSSNIGVLKPLPRTVPDVQNFDQLLLLSYVVYRAINVRPVAIKQLPEPAIFGRNRASARLFLQAENRLLESSIPLLGGIGSRGVECPVQLRKITFRAGN